ncbi:23S rRNA (cytosine1962-C5)-methyltransferase [Consotaella salsifontis]|uniref:23S rRNA (Cytosine1962-C5)-methyltransferase n=1 Tax=Consotaella salsifontis TaxID=1365950 RepID=A0A1T4QGX2_9HYPH|nr:23S rRNA (cytosine1962-C5)-methyltransferase [Consotaella salsifontis]
MRRPHRPSGGAKDRPALRHDRASGTTSHAGGASEAKRRNPRVPQPLDPAEPEERPARPPLAVREGARPLERLPVILSVASDRDYGLIDSGGGEKLERYGPLLVRRPENQAIWPRRLGEARWEDVDAVFTGDTEEEGTGRWRFPKVPLGETWPLAHDGLSYLGRFTSFRHVGVFPEQAAHWAFIEEKVRARGPVRLLNLFGYTGVASLIGARAGAEVTHVDASKKAIGWARENQELAGLGDRPIRWICEDAVRYAEREVRRGSRYDAILLDPPKYGRGPKGEVWQLFDDLPYLLSLTRELLTDRPLFVVLTAYSIRASFYTLSALMAEAMRGRGGAVESGELVIEEEGAEPRRLSTSLFSRWIADV